MRLLVAALASATFGSGAVDVPAGITPIGELNESPALRHAELLQVQRDFGQPDVNIALDAWFAADADSIQAMQLWWTDPVDRYPFSQRVLKHVELDHEAVAPDHWRVTVVGDGKRFGFEVEVHDGQAAVYADVVLRDGSSVEHCRAEQATLYARRFLGAAIGLGSMYVNCTAPDGVVHRARVRMERVKPRRGTLAPG